MVQPMQINASNQAKKSLFAFMSNVSENFKIKEAFYTYYNRTVAIQS